MTTLMLTSRKLNESIKIRCNLANAGSPVEVDYNPGTPDSLWQSTQYQAANARHSNAGLKALGRELFASAMEATEEELGPIACEEV